MKRLRWGVLMVALLALDAWLCRYRWLDMQGNIEAQFVIITPAFVLKHLADRHDRRQLHDQRMEADDRRHQERLDADQELHRKVRELHDWHLRGILPPDTLKS